MNINTNSNINVVINNTKKFNSGLSMARRIVSKRDSMSNPYFGVIRVKFDEDKVTVESNDLTNSIRLEIAANELDMNVTGGGVLYLTEKACDWIGRTDVPLSIEADDSSIKIHAGEDMIDVSLEKETFKDYDFVDLNEVDQDAQKISVVTSSFANAIRSCAANSYVEEQRCKGVAITEYNGMVEVSSYWKAGGKLCWCHVPAKNAEGASAWLEAATISKVAQTISDYAQENKIEFANLFIMNRCCWVKCGSLLVYSHGLAGEPLDIHQFENRFDWEDSIVVSRKDILNGLNNLKCFTGDEFIVLSLEKDKVCIYPQKNLSRARSVVSYQDSHIELTNEKITVDLSAFLDVFSNLPENNENVTIMFCRDKRKTSPMRIEAGMFTSMMMPSVKE
ncbi:MAG: hypothetical protein IJI14_10540 [Anaerolineaceae bacterium]|nr:hypothetical protein [Anaerolineaceae bacterium]